MAARKYGAGLNIIDSDGWHSLKFQKLRSRKKGSAPLSLYLLTVTRPG